MTTVTAFSGIKQTGNYIYNNVAVTISEITDNGRLRGSFVIGGKETSFSNSPSGLKARIDNGGINPSPKKNKHGLPNMGCSVTDAAKNMQQKSYLITFDEAFTQACALIGTYKHVACKLGKYSSKDAVDLTMILLREAREAEAKRLKREAQETELSALRTTLEIAVKSGNQPLIDSISEMIREKEAE